jgi:hypothetical protein
MISTTLHTFIISLFLFGKKITKIRPLQPPTKIVNSGITTDNRLLEYIYTVQNISQSGQKKMTSLTGAQ